jgi:selenocysteine-specific elongation factor
MSVIVGGGEGPGPPPIGVETLVDALENLVPAGGRSFPTGPFLFAVDHCFGVKGQGTVLTGTVLSGVAKVGDTLELPELRVSKKIKSMQMFKRPVQSCRQVDPCGLLII